MIALLLLAEVCGRAWAASATVADAPCVEHWLRVAYGEVDEDALALDPSYDLPGLEVFTSAELERLAARVGASCPETECCSRCQRAVELFGAAARLRFSMVDLTAMAPFEPALRKVLRGQRLRAEDLEPHGARFGPATLRRLKNAVFARHGRPFADPDLDRFFYAKEVEGRETALLPLRRGGPGEPKLGPADRHNLALIQGFSAKTR